MTRPNASTRSSVAPITCIDELAYHGYNPGPQGRW